MLVGGCDTKSDDSLIEVKEGLIMDVLYRCAGPDFD